MDPRSNAIVDMNILQSIMSQVHTPNISSTLQVIELVDVASGLSRQHQHHLATAGVGGSMVAGAAGSSGDNDGSDEATMSTTAELQFAELASIILGVIVFAGSLSTAICVLCVRYRR